MDMDTNLLHHPCPCQRPPDCDTKVRVGKTSQDRNNRVWTIRKRTASYQVSRARRTIHGEGQIPLTKARRGTSQVLRLSRPQLLQLQLQQQQQQQLPIREAQPRDSLRLQDYLLHAIRKDPLYPYLRSQLKRLDFEKLTQLSPPYLNLQILMYQFNQQKHTRQVRFLQVQILEHHRATFKREETSLLPLYLNRFLHDLHPLLKVHEIDRHLPQDFPPERAV
jgi:hypothetical protein